MARWRPGRPEPAQAASDFSARILRVAAWMMLTMVPGQLSASESIAYLLRNLSPFLHGFGVPALQGGNLTSRGAFDTRITISLANHADSGETADERIVLDGESYYVDAIFRYGLGERWEVGVDLPYVSHRSGNLDNLIEGWHDLFGLDNSEREGPSNHLELTYRRGDRLHVDVRDGGGGIGDLRLTAAYQLLAPADGERSVALRSVIKLPTGDEERLCGSGATDVAISLEATDQITFAGHGMRLLGQVGVVRLGEGYLLPDEQKPVVPFAALGATWHVHPVVDLRLQLAAQGKYFDSRLDELGGTTTSIALGGVFHLHRLGVELDVALVEDLISDATPDFGLYLSVSRTAARDPKPLVTRQGSR